MNKFWAMSGVRQMALCAVLATGFAGLSRANIITAPNSGTFPDVFSGCTGCTLVTSTGATNVAATGNAYHYSYETAVYRDPSNPFGAGDLDFVYQVTDVSGSTDNINRVTATNFTGWSTDVGYFTTAPGGDSFVNGTITPQLVDRNTADTVGFSFNTPPTPQPITPGTTSVVLVIKTNATNYTTGTVNFIDGGVSANAAFQPAAGVPEPASLLLIGTGLLALSGIRRFRRS